MSLLHSRRDTQRWQHAAVPRGDPLDGRRLPERRTALRLQVGGAVAILVLLAALLPSPRSTLAVLTGDGLPREPGAAADAVSETAMLSVATLVVWFLLGWILAVTATASASRLPGALGRMAGSLLTRLSPLAVRNVLLTVVGTSVVAGLVAYGAGPAVAATNSAAGPTVVGGQASHHPDHPDHPDHRASGVQRWVAVEGSAAQVGAPSGPGTDWPAAARPPDTGPGSTGNTGSPGSPVSMDWPTTTVPARPSASSAGSGGSAASSAGWAGSAGSVGPGASSAASVSSAAAGTATSGTVAPGAPVVVLRGDSLWSIAARSLPRGADDVQIDRAQRAWYAANRSVIGSDPDLIFPGQILLPPNPGKQVRP